MGEKTMVFNGQQKTKLGALVGSSRKVKQGSRDEDTVMHVLESVLREGYKKVT